jgi:hypothetical protein
MAVIRMNVGSCSSKDINNNDDDNNSDNNGDNNINNTYNNKNVQSKNKSYLLYMYRRTSI